VSYKSRQQIYLPEPNDRTKRRLAEVKFYTIFEQTIKHLDKNEHLATDLFEIYGELYTVEPSILKSVYMVFRNNREARPTLYEKVVMARYHGLSYAKIRRMLDIGTDRTVHTYLKRFVEEKEGHLTPSTISPSQYLDLVEAMNILRVELQSIGMRSWLLDKKEMQGEE
jgi:hypothetical protein